MASAIAVQPYGVLYVRVREKSSENACFSGEDGHNATMYVQDVIKKLSQSTRCHSEPFAALEGKLREESYFLNQLDPSLRSG
jgi:hypothetical protein